MDFSMIGFTLHRYIFRELFRVFVLATTALTLIVSLGLVIPAIQKYGVGPDQLVHLLGYFLPIALMYVLPLGTLFASSLVYGRFASDNELNACRASGVSMMTLVYPGFFLAVAVSIATLVLSFHVVPAFAHRAEKAIKANAKQILFRNIQRNGYYEIDRKKLMIQADRADAKNNVLTGVNIIKQVGGVTTKLITADKAKILIDQTGTENVVRIVAREAYQIDDNGQEYFKELPISGRFESLLRDNIKFQRNDQIKKIKADMMEFYPIRQEAINARGQLAIEMLSEDIMDRISDKEDYYYRFERDDKIVAFTAHQSVAREDRTIDLTGPILLLEFDGVTHAKICEWKSAKGRIRLEDTDQLETSLYMVLENPQWDRGGGINGLTPQHVIKKLPMPERILDQLGTEGLLATLDAVDSILKGSPTGDLRGKIASIKKEIKKTFIEIIAETHSRLIFGIGCISLILTSIALGIMLKGGHLLSAFGISSIPFGVLIIFMMSGRQLTKHPEMTPSTGLYVMWSGLLLLTLLMLGLYRKLLKT
jgi:lipopolysaccharide export LptBFGC system permease protein LptF